MRHPQKRRRPWGGVPPFGLRRRIFWSLVGAMITAGAFTLLLSRLIKGMHGQTVWTVGGLALFAIISLWLASGRLAFRLVYPLNRLVDAVQRFGQGDYSARTGFSPAGRDEVSRVAKAIDAMAERIEVQMKEERQLLAVVSHELRTPMARIRVLTDLARAGHPKSLDDIDREVAEVDDLVSNILARSRLEFGTLSRKPIRVAEAVSEALDRAGLPAELLRVEGERVYDAVDADPTLLHRSIANLLDNARRHGEGVAGVEVRSSESKVTVEVLDRGPGFDSVPDQRFKAFVPSSHGLGLGLHLVERIVLAHGGRVWAENRPDGGARVGFELPFADT